MTARLAVQIGGLRLRNPVMTASGTFGYGREFTPFMDISRLGAIVGKTVTREPRPGNKTPRVFETAGGMLNSIGLQNPGIDRFLAEMLPEMAALGAPVVVNVAGADAEEFALLCARVDGAPGAAAIELNLSCPNVSHGMDLAQEPAALGEAVALCRKATKLPLFAKLTPNVTAIEPLARAAEAGGADAISLVNTFQGLAVDWRRRRPVLGGGTGGLSGPAIKPLALRFVHQAARAVRLPVIGIGGIASAEDALEFICAGARAIQVGTASFVEPAAAVGVADGLGRLLAEAGIADVNDLVGTLAL